MAARAIHPGRAALLVELAVALTLIGIITTLTAQAISAYMKTRDHYTWRQAAAWAAEAQLQRYMSGAAIDSPPPEDILPAEITLHTHVQPGKGQWESFRLVTVTAQVTRRHHKTLVEEVRCYLPDEMIR